ncbi:hypothetical protein COV18_05765 [Candidatus Woesearchaeota archaeon CG10_big_fil_rev_8_21_14_0_10_37_12]|nr:MAG: hypothetical protein COV18_05765 [Candidatus Woesearchaeota archaeon CG10_big_fil_rev_8_21_14_0_10_37_12]
MNLQGLGKIESFQTYLDIAFQRGTARVVETKKLKIKDPLAKTKETERQRIDTITRSLTDSLGRIERCFPSIDDLDPFYLELIKCALDYVLLKKSLGALNWAGKQIKSVQYEVKGRLYGARTADHVIKARVAFSGRVSSVMKQIKKNLEYLEEARKIMKSFPSIKTDINTVVIAGFPNVGKTTLLAALTGSTPKIAHYPFTTQTLNLGYEGKEIQYVDTPGLLDRPLSARNPIERQAIIALKHVAKIILFVIDPTETCGYTVKQQKNLLLEIKKAFKLPIILVSNKADQNVEFEKAMKVSAKEKTGIDELKKEIKKELNNEVNA